MHVWKAQKAEYIPLVLIQLFSPMGYYSCLIIREARPVPLQGFSVHQVLLDKSDIRNILSFIADEWFGLQLGPNSTKWIESHLGRRRA